MFISKFGLEPLWINIALGTKQVTEPKNQVLKSCTSNNAVIKDQILKPTVKESRNVFIFACSFAGLSCSARLCLLLTKKICGSHDIYSRLANKTTTERDDLAAIIALIATDFRLLIFN